MVGLCEGGNDNKLPDSLKAIVNDEGKYGGDVSFDDNVNGIDDTGYDDVLKVILRHFINILRYLASECDEGDNAGEMSPGSSTESYPAFARIGLRENPEKKKNLNQNDIQPSELAQTVAFEIRIREVPGSNPVADQSDWGFYGFP
ncbi:hypothetical protein ANN_16988 [Periplaneta americana]|uniref:Uncharacterized protein n=1 Tax=Periplaneta americana TaxID=6978 RepID=A0ABQ8SRM8_PERAM|nr:hypothetical protein ANN_16988 [Periplaneta americana]